MLEVIIIIFQVTAVDLAEYTRTISKLIDSDPLLPPGISEEEDAFSIPSL